MKKLLVFIFCAPLIALGQPLVEKIYKIESGLSNNQLSFIFEKNIDGGNNYYEITNLRSGSIKLANDTQFSAIPSDSASIIYMVRPNGTLGFFKSCKNGVSYIF